mmetsp:Transcript_51695/g.117872  ORF Transcript_51695/g.117872 Transcript_51695/m.117872 type:complete len:201 (+) Transcript_51695:1047-1649(+)
MRARAAAELPKFSKENPEGILISPNSCVPKQENTNKFRPRRAQIELTAGSTAAKLTSSTLMAWALRTTRATRTARNTRRTGQMDITSPRLPPGGFVSSTYKNVTDPSTTTVSRILNGSPRYVHAPKAHILATTSRVKTESNTIDRYFSISCCQSSMPTWSYSIPHKSKTTHASTNFSSITDFRSRRTFAVTSGLTRVGRA